MGNCTSLPLRRRRYADDPALAEALYTKPSGLYPTCLWDERHVRRLILRGDLAPRYPGLDDASGDVREECPICMLVYPDLNQTKCCAARLCTECFLQIRPPRHNKEPCPFCKHRRVDAVYAGPRDRADVDREERDGLRALAAVKAAAAVAAATAATTTASAASTAPPSDPTPSPARHESHYPQSASAVSHSADSHAPASASSPTAASSSAAASAPARRARSCVGVPCMCPGQACANARLCAWCDNSRAGSSCRAGGVCPFDHQTHFVHPADAPDIDPLLLESMASEVSFSGAGERASRSASASASATASASTSSSALHLLDGSWRQLKLAPEPSDEVERDHSSFSVSFSEAARRSIVDM